jgi:hypothetical protein
MDTRYYWIDSLLRSESNSHLGFECLAARQRGCELPLRGRIRRERRPIHGPFDAENNHHAALKSGPNSIRAKTQ